MVSVVVPHPVKPYTVRVAATPPSQLAAPATAASLPPPTKLWWTQKTLNVRTGQLEILPLPCGRDFVIERKETLDSPWAFFTVTNQPPVLIPATGFYRVGRRP